MPGRRVVHGHTIVGDMPISTPFRVSIDTGAYESGRLTCAVFDGSETSFAQTRRGWVTSWREGEAVAA